MQYIPHIKQAFDQLNPTEGGNNTSEGQNPLAKKLNMLKKASPPSKPMFNNSDQTGISIAKGSYLNINGQNGQTSQNQPTWKTLENQEYYKQHFQDIGPKMVDMGASNGLKRDKPGYYGNDDSGNDRGGKNNYKPSYNTNGGGYKNQGNYQANRHLDEQYKRLADPSNLSRQNQDRIQRLMDATDGGDIDMNKAAKYFQKTSNNWDHLDGPPGYDYNKKGQNNQG